MAPRRAAHVKGVNLEGGHEEPATILALEGVTRSLTDLMPTLLLQDRLSEMLYLTRQTSSTSSLAQWSCWSLKVPQQVPHNG